MFWAFPLYASFPLRYASWEYAFGTGECALRHEERANGGRLRLLLTANATSVSMAPQLCCPF